MRQSENDMIERIFSATDQLMAQEGLPNLSMHKIAKQAGISAGTIYLYFKNKEELLSEFARALFKDFQHTLQQDYDSNKSYFARYQQMWWNVWHFLQGNPTTLSNIRQYESLPNFQQMCREWEQQNCWKQFCTEAQQANELCDLPANILFLLSLSSAIELALEAKNMAQDFSVELLESVIMRTWQAIKK